MSLKEFAEQERLPCQLLCAFIVRKQVEEFVAKDGDAAGLESDDGDAGIDFGGEFVENLQKKFFCAIEHAEVVEWASAAEVGLRDDDVVAGGFEDFDGGFAVAGRK